MKTQNPISQKEMGFSFFRTKNEEENLKKMIMGENKTPRKVAMSVGGSRDVPYNPLVNELLHFLQQLPRRKNVLGRIIQDRFHALRFKELNWSSTCAINAQVATDG
jgi:hypothetical protein